MMMPFVVCASKGGPYADDAYVAGWEAGRLDLVLSGTRIPVGASIRLSQPIRAENEAQIDLIAMRHGLTADFEENGIEGWKLVRFRKPREIR